MNQPKKGVGAYLCSLLLIIVVFLAIISPAPPDGRVSAIASAIKTGVFVLILSVVLSGSFCLWLLWRLSVPPAKPEPLKLALMLVPAERIARLGEIMSEPSTKLTPGDGAYYLAHAFYQLGDEQNALGCLARARECYQTEKKRKWAHRKAYSNTALIEIQFLLDFDRVEEAHLAWERLNADESFKTAYKNHAKILSDSKLSLERQIALMQNDVQSMRAFVDQMDPGPFKSLVQARLFLGEGELEAAGVHIDNALYCSSEQSPYMIKRALRLKAELDGRS